MAKVVEGSSELVMVKNKQVLFKDYVNGYPKESDMVVTSEATIHLDLPNSEGGLVLLKNMYLSCDPYMRGRMNEAFKGSYTSSFTPNLVCIY